MMYSPFSPPRLELVQLGCARGGQALFEGVSLRLDAGQWLKVTGANGTGKTSLLRVLGGLLAPSQGQALWRGSSVTAQRERLGQERLWLGHAPALKDELSAVENLEADCALAGQPITRSRALATLDELGLRDAEAYRPVRRLSQGQRRRCALARLPLARQRPLWVLDEPYTSLDHDACDWLSRQVQGHVRAGGVLVITSHQLSAIDALPHQELAL